MNRSQVIPMNSKLSGRELRRRLNAREAFVNEQVTPAVQQLLHNSSVARTKIDALEAAQATWQALTFWQRVRWIVKGAV